MKLPSAALIVLERAINAWGWQTHINLYKVEHYGSDNILEYAVNWAGMGSKSPEETYEFIDNLKTAARICDAINNERFEVVRMRLESVFATEEEYDAAAEELTEYIKDCRHAAVARWLYNHCVE